MMKVKALGVGSIGEFEGPRLAVLFEGRLTTLGIDAKTHRIMAFTHRSRGPQLYFGNLVRHLSGHEWINGVLVPKNELVTFDGKPATQLSTIFDSIKVDSKLSPSLFTKP